MAKVFLKSFVLTIVLSFFITCFGAHTLAQQAAADSDSTPLPPPLAPAPSPSSPPLPLPFTEDPPRIQVTLEVLWDGNITARDPQTNDVRWSFSSGPPLSSAHGLLLDAYEGTNSSIGVTASDSLDEFIFLGTDWKLYSFDKQRGIDDLPISPHELVQNTPTVLDGALILGSVSTSVVLLDARSGSVVRTFDSRNESFETENLGDKDILQILERSLKEQQNVDYLFVFRKDYIIKSVSMASGALLWNVSVGDVQLRYINSEGVFSLPAPGDKSLLDPSMGQSVLHPVVLPACGDEKKDRLLPAQVHDQLLPAQVQDWLLPAQVHSSNDAKVYLQLISIKMIFVSCVTIVCIIVSYLFWWKRDTGKRNEDVKQLTRKRKPSKKKTGFTIVAQEVLQEARSEARQEQNSPVILESKIVSEGNQVFLSIGSLRVLTRKQIGVGSNGTLVFDGYLDNRPVAVKRMLKEYYDKAQKEINHLIKSDEHPNILRYFHVESDQNFLYVALERCRCSLNDLVLAQSAQYLGVSESKPMPGDLTREELNQLVTKVGDIQDFQLWDDWGRPSAKLLKLMRDILAGLAHLHDVGIIHRDLKPHNVLISNGRVCQAKLSDMGISKQLADGLTSLESQSTGLGSSGWQAPEQLMRSGPQTRSVDMFSLGCILFFCISGGYHPYGTRFERDHNIMNGKRDLFRVEHVPEAFDLVSDLLHLEPEQRLDVHAVRVHPLFWRSDLRLKFLCDASDRVELGEKDSQSPLFEDLEAASPVALGGVWSEKLDGVFLANLGKHRKYNYNSVRDLLRLIRNKSSHFRELPLEVQRLFDSFPDGFEAYFRTRFPKLLLEVYKVVRWHCKTEEGFTKYFSYSSAIL